MGRSFDSHPLVEGYGTSCRGAPELSYCLHNVGTAQFRGAGDCSEGAFTSRTAPNYVVIWQSRTSHVITKGILGGVSAGCKPWQTMPKMAMATLNGGFRATVLTTPTTDAQSASELAYERRG